jgi:hypothetical protein
MRIQSSETRIDVNVFDELQVRLECFTPGTMEDEVVGPVESSSTSSEEILNEWSGRRDNWSGGTTTLVERGDV